MRSSFRWPSTSMKNRYSHSALLAAREGRDSMRDMLTPLAASGDSNACTAPGLLSAVMTSDVRSRPVGAVSILPSTRKRVVLFGSSSIERATMVKPNRSLAICPAIAALPGSSAARRGIRVGHYLDALGIRQVLVQPAVTLGERLRMGINALHAREVAVFEHEVLLHPELDLGADFQRRR